jgi:hypothetical protein
MAKGVSEMVGGLTRRQWRKHPSAVVFKADF